VARDVDNIHVTLINPLDAALGHYTAALVRLFEDMGVSVQVRSITEPSSAPYGKFRWLSMYIRLLASARRRAPGVIVVVTWPVLGYWDFALIRAVTGRRTPYVVVHDPCPLARAIGYGRVSRWAAGGGAIRAKAIVHSEVAGRTIASKARGVPTVQLPLPMFSPRKAPDSSDADVVVRVLGQYKAVRDVGALERIAASCDPSWRYEIVGRGWPAVNGWAVTSAFVTESEFNRLIVTSSAVVIPYRRFFQSDVALRCLEMGTPVVGPRDSSLAELLGPDSPCLVTDGRWSRAVNAAVGFSATEAFGRAQTLYDETVRRWHQWLAEIDVGVTTANGASALPTAKMLRRSRRAWF
jgi:hypothetical protein